MAILRELALDEDGDLALARGGLFVLDGPEALAQRVSVRLKTIKGEWVFDKLIGTPWFQQILGGGARNRLGLISQVIRKRILDTPGVDRILELELDFDAEDRGLTITGRIVAEGEELPISLEVG